ncbi:TPA: hypothetical protein N0G48_001523 [Pseudomonas aeruginosa]|nr:hypothetical protein [Pseudomonas aeruginosa]
MAEQDGAVSRYDRPYQIVSEQIDLMNQRADAALGKAYETLQSLQDIGTALDTLPPTPTIDLPNTPDNPFPDIPVPARAELPAIGDIQVPDLNLDFSDIDQGLGELDEPPEFSPSVIGIDLPPRPAPIDTSGAPVRPDTGSVDLPVAPSITMPDVGDLVPISVPEFVFPDLPRFDESAPVFDGSAPSTVLQWAEPTYQSTNLELLKSTLARMLAGGTGLPPAIEQALFDRARVREDINGQKAVDDAFQDFASRGHMLPPGALLKRVADIREANQLKVSETAREILINSAQWEIDNLRTAVERGIGLEAQLMDQFNAMAQRAFDAARLRLESDISLYNAEVSLFNARQSAYQVAADVYGKRLQGELAKLEVFKAQIEGEKAKGDLNEQTVRVYTARLQGVTSLIDIYRAKMEGAKVQADLIKAQIEAYGTDVQAYAQKLQAKKTEYDAYEAGVRAEQAKIGILEAESRAFAATVQAYESKNNVKIQGVRARVDVASAKISQYTAQLQAEQARVQAELSNIQAITQAFQADVGRYSAQINAASADRDLQARTVEARLRNNLAYYEIELKKYDAAIQQLLQRVQVQSEAMKSVGTITAQLASGAMAATNVSASMSGSAGISSSDSLSIGHNHTYNEK